MGKEPKVRTPEYKPAEIPYEIILVIISIIHICVAPLAKVEESFNLQAIHDILFHRTNIDKYDHLEFPGVVPRTFIGPLIVATLSSPFVYVSRFFFTKFAAQIIVRICISIIFIVSFRKFRQSISQEFGKTFSLWLVLITASQFHLMFYMGRTLPNIFAMPAALLAMHYWIKGNHKMLIALGGFDAIVFRSELAMLFGLIMLFELFHRRVSLLSCFKYAIPVGILSIALTVSVDSLFWKRLLWPEGEVFWFNTFLNQSHKWGVQPFFWYFYSALPRAMASSFFLIPYGLYANSRVRNIFLPCFLFVLFFSFLPHKELRFIFYALPIFNVAAAAACDRVWSNRGKTFIHALISVAIIFHLVLNGVISTGMLVVSSKNYPGGNALLKLEKIEPLTSKINVHIDVFSAQTGISRFLELSPHWTYNKSENLKADSPEMMEFTHLVMGAGNVELQYLYFKSHEVMLTIEGFTGIDLNIHRLPPVKIKSEPQVLVLRKLAKT